MIHDSTTVTRRDASRGIGFQPVRAVGADKNAVFDPAVFVLIDGNDPRLPLPLGTFQGLRRFAFFMAPQDCAMDKNVHAPKNDRRRMGNPHRERERPARL